MFFCDPPGTSDPEHLFNFGDDCAEFNYILFHDQEPIHSKIHTRLFEDTVRRNIDLNHGKGPIHSAIVTSELNSEIVNQVCKKYNWKSYYYFFHGWAALDWYRGYDKTYLMSTPQDRTITKTFINPNRIIGGYREHRVLLMYHLLKHGIQNAWTSFPDHCPVEDLSITEIAGHFKQQYPDIVDVFASADLPMNFPGEEGHPMHSCWLSLFDLCAESLTYVVTETVFAGQRNHLTEKSFKPICLGMPFVIVSTQGSLEYLRSYGFKTFGHLWDESYDNEPDDYRRIEKVSQLLKDLDNLSTQQKQDLFQQALPTIQHNFDHFYSGAFEKILWDELQGMLNQIAVDFNK